MSPDLGTICLKCLQKDPSHRYASAEMLAEDLERWSAGEPIQARPAGKVERLWRWCRRNPALAGMTAVAALSLVLGLVTSTLFAIQASRTASNLASTLEESERTRRQLQEYAATSALRRGLNLLQEYNEDDALLWFAHALELAPDDAQALQQETRRHLTDFGQKIGPKGAQLEHDDAINQVALSPDGRTIVTASADRTARVWDTAPRRPIRTLEGHQDAVLSVGFSSDGRLLFTGSADRTAKLWNAATGQCVFTLPGHPRGVGRGRFSPDGRILVTMSGDSFFGQEAEAWLWDTATGKHIGVPIHHQSTLIALAFAPDGKSLLTWGQDKKLRRWDLTTGQAVEDVFSFPDVADWRSSVAFSPDGRLFLVGKKGQTASLWEIATGKQQGEPVWHGSFVAGVAFSADGKSFATLDENATTKFWDTATHRPIDPFLWTTSQCLLYFSRDGTQLFVHEPRRGNRSVYDATALNERLTGMIIRDPIPHGAASTGSYSQLELIARGSNTFPFVETAPLDGTAEQLVLWAQVVSRRMLDDHEQIQRLDEEAWNQKRRLLAEQVQQQALSGVLANAAEDSLHWVRREAQEVEGDWSKAVRYLDRLIQAEPTWEHFERRATAYAQLGQLSKALRDYDQVIQQASKRPRRVFPKWREIGATRLLQGDIKGYREACHAMVDFDLCLLSPTSKEDIVALLPQLAAQVAQDPKSPNVRYGAALIRTGKAEAGVQQLTDTNMRFKDSPKIMFFLALGHHQLGHPAEARKWLNQAGERLSDEELTAMSLFARLEAQVLRREVEAALEKK